MSSLRLQHVSVEFPIYQAGARSLKKILFAGTTMGNLARDAHDRVNVRALSDISLDIADGERIGIIGANGAGKTTLFRMLVGQEQPGNILVEGCDRTLRHTSLWAAQQQFDVEQVLRSVREFGGFCDCEVLFNVTPDKFGW